MEGAGELSKWGPVPLRAAGEWGHPRGGEMERLEATAAPQESRQLEPGKKAWGYRVLK